MVCLYKTKGDLGIKSLSIFNKALLCIWSWHFVIKIEALWNQVIRGKYREKQEGCCQGWLWGGIVKSD